MYKLMNTYNNIQPQPSAPHISLYHHANTNPYIRAPYYPQAQEPRPIYYAPYFVESSQQVLQ
jgi:hypothetical protein